MAQPAVTFDSVSKTFKGYVRTSVGKAALDRLRGVTATRGEVHALKRVSFDVMPGESVALMGLNGSGKTTALSLVARISSPSSGTITIRGRVGALLAVGTGLHGDLTGRENIEVYGRILGYSAAAIRRKFDEIVEFAEISQALDRPLKFFSSGMQLRLGFSVAAHVEPEVMLVDEAISVGDVLFQQRCLEKMTELVQGGSALLLVSHQPEIVARTCRTGMLLRSGELLASGPVDEIIGAYLKETGGLAWIPIDGGVELKSADISDVDFDAKRIVVRATVQTSGVIDNPKFGVTVADLERGALVTASMVLDGFSVGVVDGAYQVICELTDVPLRAGIYRITIYTTTSKGGDLLMAPHVLGHITWGDPTAAPVAVGKQGFGPVQTEVDWNFEKA